jgi:type I restriction enzyme M protein
MTTIVESTIKSSNYALAIANNAILTAIKALLEDYASLCIRTQFFLSAQGATPYDMKKITERDSNTVDTDTLNFIQSNMGFIILDEHMFSSWVSEGYDFSFDDVNQAIRCFERLNAASTDPSILASIATLDALIATLPKSTAIRNKILSRMVSEIKESLQ